MLTATLSCLQALNAVPAGAMPVAADFVAAPCSAAPARVLRYDPGGRAVRAVRDIEAGETVSAVPPAMLPDVRAGDALFLVARVGGIIVERAVSAAQPGRRGRPIFVRTEDGRTLSATLGEEQ